jgi:hypothetical protein
MKEAEKRVRPQTHRQVIRICSMLGISACLGDLLMTRFLGTRFPGYRALLQTMSDLGHPGSPVARMASDWWVVMGVLFIAFGFGFHRVFSDRGKSARAAGWMLALYGIGEGLGSGLIPGSPAAAFSTPESVFHNLVGGVGVVAAFVLPFLIMNMLDGRRSPHWCWYSWITTVVGISFFALFSVATFYHPEGSWISFLGLWQRLFMLTYYVYFVSLAVLMLARTAAIDAHAWRRG